MSKQNIIQGTVAPGFESVKQLFEDQMHTMAERQAQLCVYHRGERVVDLWADKIGDSNFSADSIANVFSSGKSLEAIAVAYLVDRGQISYDAKVTEYWPEFGANGKEGITVADVMRHEAGMATFDSHIDMEELFTDKLKQNSVGRIIEQHGLNYDGAGGGKREYHGFTRGWIINEVFRRAEPSGRTIGEFLRDEISGPLNVDVIIGVREEQMSKRIQVKALGLGKHLLYSLVPRILGRKVVHSFFTIFMFLVILIKGLRNSGGGDSDTTIPFKGEKLGPFNYFEDPNFARGETPSANANCSARGLAKLAAMMSAGGTLEGKQHLSPQAWQAMHDHPLESKMAMGVFLTTHFSQGGVNFSLPTTSSSTTIDRDMNDGREGFIGWAGFGGSIFMWHPELDIGFAFVPTYLHTIDLFNVRGKRYQAEVLKCVKALEAAS